MTIRLLHILFLFLFFIPSNNAPAQIRRVERSNIVKVDFLSAVAFRRFGIAYERVITSNFSGQLGFQVTADGYTVSPEFRYYMLRQIAPEGFFVSPFGRIIGSNAGGGLGYGFGGLVGYQVLITSRISADAFIGPAYKYLAKESDWELWAGITIGFAF